MRVLFFLWGTPVRASTRVRGLYMAGQLRKMGLDCSTACGLVKYLSLPFRFKGYDRILFHRCYPLIDVCVQGFAKRIGKITVFDLDDAPFGVSRSPRKEKEVIRIMRNSNAVIVGSRKLAEFAKRYNDRVYQVPTTIDLDYYRPRKKTEDRDRITLGWIGASIGYKKDLLSLIKPLEELGGKYKIKLILVGALRQKDIHKAFGAMKNVTAEIIDTLDWADPLAGPSAIARFDIGLYPLIDNEYNQYKCAFKALEYMAMGLPAVASPVGENRFVIDNGVDGFLASNDEEWKDGISRLIEDTGLRREMGQKGRDKIERSYSTELWAGKLVKIFEEIHKT
ncbi:glycosyltransferase [Candidatus Omnitrophota bacterium]